MKILKNIYLDVISSNLKELIDIKPKKAIYIKSVTEPFDDEMEFDEKRINNWLKHFNLCPVYKMHVSGHASGPELLNMIKRYHPENLYPSPYSK